MLGLLLSMALVSPVSASPARGHLFALQAATCVVNGVPTTETTITGTAGDDTIDCTGTTANLTIDGAGGNDTITGGLGNDTLIGGEGNDTITGGPGNDCISGGPGNDTLTGSEGSNTIFPGAGENTVSDNTDPEGAVTGCTTDPGEPGGTDPDPDGGTDPDADAGGEFTSLPNTGHGTPGDRDSGPATPFVLALLALLLTVAGWFTLRPRSDQRR